MTQRLYEILALKYAQRDFEKPWVFWNPRTGLPYRDRKSIMKRLCKESRSTVLSFPFIETFRRIPHGQPQRSSRRNPEDSGT